MAAALEDAGHRSPSHADARRGPPLVAHPDRV